MTAIVWFRRDLRLHDNPALHTALCEHDQLVPVFCLDDRLLSASPHRSDRRTRFMLGCLDELARDIDTAGSELVVLHDRPETALPQITKQCGADTVYAAQDVSVFARRRDHRVATALREQGVELEVTPGLFTVEDLGEVVTAQGDHYTVFTPFHKRWLNARRRSPYPAPRRLPPLPSSVEPSPLPGPEQLDLAADEGPPDPPLSWEPGEGAARNTVARMLGYRADGYEQNHDLLGAGGTSELSPYLHFGSVSPREVERELADGAGPQALRRQLAWRDFYAQVLFNNPHNSVAEHQQRYRRKISWNRSMRDFDTWRLGRTGYPVVDAGMRQLAQTGWMHNRARMIVGSFLVKDLGIDWRWGERWFMQNLIDGDQANNNGNWQWIASVGVDPQPVSRRIYNPTLQQERFDPEGEYVRTYVPELRQVPDEYLTQPWTMPVEVQRQASCVIGADYPEPIVDHKQARREALERYRSAAAT